MQSFQKDNLLVEYAAIERRVLAALRDDLSEAEFGALALEIHAFQLRWNEPLARWCATFPAPKNWCEIPAVPQAMFKRFRVACFPPELVEKTFLTSGTTGETRGAHHLHNTTLYDGAVLAGWRRLTLPKAVPLIVTPSPADAPNSSLSHMMGLLAGEAGQFITRSDSSLDIARAAAALERNFSSGQPVALLGTALGFLNLMESWGNARPRLCEGSFLVETGGFKGSGREIEKSELYARLGEFFGLKAGAIWNEYGMCELGSQFYTRDLGAAHTGGPWVRAMVVSPETGREVAVGERGVLRIFDLANLGSTLAVQTADFAVRRDEGFELIGRDPAAVPRGCSRLADEKRGAVSASVVVPRTQAAPSNGNTQARCVALAAAANRFPFLGEVSADSLRALIAAELGHAEALDRFIPHGAHHSRAVAPATILHILSGNTPAAALQALLRGLLLGSRNLCKLPSSGLPEVAQFLVALPPELRALVEVSGQLPGDWLARADAIIVFGNDETIAHFRALAQPWQTFIAHGHKLSFGIVFDDPAFASAAAAACDASVFDQQGCLSPHVIYVRESGTFTAKAYAERVAAEMAVFEKHSPRGPLTLSEANSIRTLRDETTFRVANGEPLALFASADSAWTVIADSTPGFPSSPLNRVLFIKPLPADLADTLAPVRAHLSTCGICPSTHEHAEFAASLGVTRICPLGKMQQPPLTWHHDGVPVLAPLVRWIDWGE